MISACCYVMAKEWAKGFYNSDAWQMCRDGFIAERISVDGGMCQICHEMPGYIVHHKVHLTATNINDPSISLCWDNMEYVCKHCHDVLHGFCGTQTRQARVVFDSRGEAAPTPPRSAASKSPRKTDGALRFS